MLIGVGALAVALVHRGLEGDGDGLIAQDGDGVGLRGAHHGDGAQGAPLLGQDGQQLFLLVQHQLAAGAVEGLVEGGPVGLVGAGGGEHRAGGAVVGGGVGGQDDGVVLQGAAQGGQIDLVAALALGEQQVVEQDGRLAPGDVVPAGDGQAVGQAAGLAQAHIAVIPVGAGGHVAVAVAQHPHEDGDGLPIGNCPVWLEGPVPHAHDQPGTGGGVLPRAAADGDGGGQVHVAPGPVGGAHVGEDGAAALGGLFAAAAHDLHGHLAELRPGQGAAGFEAGASGTVHHAQQAEHLRGVGGAGVGNIGEAGGAGSRGRRQHQQARHQRRRQQAGQESSESHTHVLLI